jgi:hypothetical protein
MGPCLPKPTTLAGSGSFQGSLKPQGQDHRNRDPNHRRHYGPPFNIHVFLFLFRFLAFQAIKARISRRQFFALFIAAQI